MEVALVDGAICATTSPIMVCFFVVSGFSIYYNNSNRNLLDAGELRTFYKKRFITLFPIYILVQYALICISCEYSPAEDIFHAS